MGCVETSCDQHLLRAQVLVESVLNPPIVVPAASSGPVLSEEEEGVWLLEPTLSVLH